MVGNPCLDLHLEQAKLAFPESKRNAWRVFGIESFGRLKPIELKLTKGRIAHCYTVECSLEDHKILQVSAIAIGEKVLWANRVIDHSQEDKRLRWGKWRLGHPKDFEGFSAARPHLVSEKMLALWQKKAENHGLKADGNDIRKAFFVLSVLIDLGVRL